MKPGINAVDKAPLPPKHAKQMPPKPPVSRAEVLIFLTTEIEKGILGCYTAHSTAPNGLAKQN